MLQVVGELLLLFDEIVRLLQSLNHQLQRYPISVAFIDFNLRLRLKLFASFLLVQAYALAFLNLYRFFRPLPLKKELFVLRLLLVKHVLEYHDFVVDVLHLLVKCRSVLVTRLLLIHQALLSLVGLYLLRPNVEIVPLVVFAYCIFSLPRQHQPFLLAKVRKNQIRGLKQLCSFLCVSGSAPVSCCSQAFRPHIEVSPHIERALIIRTSSSSQLIHLQFRLLVMFLLIIAFVHKEFVIMRL